MNRKRNGFEYNNHEENRYGPMTKKIRIPLSPSFDKLHLNNKIDESILLNGQNGSMKSMIISNLSPQVLQIILKKFFSSTDSSDFENNYHCICSL
jgi:hypothetical protein